MCVFFLSLSFSTWAAVLLYAIWRRKKRNIFHLFSFVSPVHVRFVCFFLCHFGKISSFRPLWGIRMWRTNVYTWFIVQATRLFRFVSYSFIIWISKHKILFAIDVKSVAMWLFSIEKIEMCDVPFMLWKESMFGIK